MNSLCPFLHKTASTTGTKWTEQASLCTRTHKVKLSNVKPCPMTRSHPNTGWPQIPGTQMAIPTLTSHPTRAEPYETAGCYLLGCCSVCSCLGHLSGPAALYWRQSRVLVVDLDKKEAVSVPWLQSKVLQPGVSLSPLCGTMGNSQPLLVHLLNVSMCEELLSSLGLLTPPFKLASALGAWPLRSPAPRMLENLYRCFKLTCYMFELNVEHLCNWFVISLHDKLIEYVACYGLSCDYHLR